MNLNHLSTHGEDFLYYVWKTRNFSQRSLKATGGEVIQVIHPGRQNFDSGPDFSEAQIRIDDKLWAGQVEMHIRSSDWLRHGHDSDKAYDNVILHVVLEDDALIVLPGGGALPCLVMKDLIPPKISDRYAELVQSLSDIPCGAQLAQVDTFISHSWLERIVAERMQERTGRLVDLLDKLENDWEEGFYKLLLRNFGFHTNAPACELLSQSFSSKVLSRHKSSLLQIESLLFGQAGLLEGNFTDDYPQRLQTEYLHLRNKYRLQPIAPHLWKFMRMRPANFPTIRLAQFAVLFYRTQHLFSKMLAAANVNELAEMFRSDVSNYWKTHYRFDEPSVKKSKKLGKAAIQLIIINTVVPAIFLYGKKHGLEKYQDHALDLLAALPSEGNKITRTYSKLGLVAENALQSQSLLHLKSTYCDKHQCLRCSIGHHLLTRNATCHEPQL